MRIKKRVASVLGIAAVAVIGASTFAAGEKIKVIDVDAWGSGSSGGPFEVQPINFPANSVQGLGLHGAAAGNFITFCIEKDEFLNQGKTYDVVLNTEAVDGGSGGPSPDPLDARTAFLFTAFMKGTLDDKLALAGLSPFTYESEPSGGDLQDAIWSLEQEPTGTLSQLAKDLIKLADDAVASGGEWEGKGIGNVRVLNMTSNSGLTNNQDLLVLIPLPIPAALGLVGLFGVGAMSYRRRRVAL